MVKFWIKDQNFKTQEYNICWNSRNNRHYLEKTPTKRIENPTSQHNLPEHIGCGKTGIPEGTCGLFQFPEAIRKSTYFDNSQSTSLHAQSPFLVSSPPIPPPPHHWVRAPCFKSIRRESVEHFHPICSRHVNVALLTNLGRQAHLQWVVQEIVLCDCKNHIHSESVLSAVA